MKRYYITDRKSVGGFQRLFGIVVQQMKSAVEMIQIREKDASAREVFEFARAVITARTSSATKILINTRADIALAADCDGVHLPSRAFNPGLPGLLVGRSCHTAEEVRQADADFVTFSPVFASPGKASATGLHELRVACRMGKPVFALGGVTWGNAEACVEAGAAGIAGIRLFQTAD